METSFDNPGEKKIVTSITELPHLHEGYVRVVHIAPPERVDEIIANGLDYRNQGMAMSTARAWGDEKEVEYGSDDPRFNHEGLKVVVFDVPNDEWKLHNAVGKAPGIIPTNQIVGLVDVVVKK